MATQLHVDIRNAKLEVMEEVIGEDPILKLFAGTLPPNCDAPDVGDALCTIELPVDWLSDAANGQKVKAGTWSDAGVAGTVNHFRIYSADEICRMQGSVTTMAHGGFLRLSNIVLETGKAVVISDFILVEGNA
jgi:hypothetical protein